MAVVNYIIEQSNIELVRSQVAFILADEIANQVALIGSTPTQDQQLTLDSIPKDNRVHEERFIKPSEELYNLLNVTILNNPLNHRTGFAQQEGDATINIEVYSRGEHLVNTDGDQRAAIKLHRLLSLCRHILMSPHYVRLGLATGIVGKREVTNIEIFQPDEGMVAGYVITGNFSLMVRVHESQQEISGVPLTSSQTTHRLYDTNEGYFYEI